MEFWRIHIQERVRLLQSFALFTILFKRPVLKPTSVRLTAKLSAFEVSVAVTDKLRLRHYLGELNCVSLRISFPLQVDIQ